MKGKRLVKSDYALNIINKVYVILVGILSTSFITRYLGVQLRGDYSYVQQVANVAVLILGLGFNQSYSYYYRQSGGHAYHRFLNIYSCQMCLYTMLSLVACLVFKEDQYVVYSAMLIPFSVMFQQMEGAMAVENIRLKIMMHMVNATAKVLAFGAMFYGATHIGTTLLYPILLTMLIDFVTVVIYSYSNGLRPNPLKVDWGFTVELVKFSFLPMLTILLVTLNYSVDIMILKAIGNPYDLSLYAVAAGIINYIWLIPDAFKEVLVSRVSRSDDLEQVHFALRVSLAVVLIIGLGFSVFGRPFLWLLYGDDFVPAYGVVIVLIIGCLSMVSYKVLNVLMLAEGRRWFCFVTLLCSAGMNVVANYLLIPRFGMYGAAWASVISYTICGGIFFLYYCIIKGQSPIRVLLPNGEDLRKIASYLNR